jgi:hypothetical protein
MDDILEDYKQDPNTGSREFGTNSSTQRFSKLKTTKTYSTPPNNFITPSKT